VASVTQLADTAHVLLARDAPPRERSAAELARLLAAAGIPVESSGPSEADLEDVFVAVLLGERFEDGESGSVPSRVEP
jgi:hypothetical protein